MEEKLFYKIGEVSRITGVKPFVLRFWETEFPLLGPKRNKGRQRVYTRKEIDRIAEIKNLLYREGLTLSGARTRLQGNVPIHSFSQDTLGQIRKELEEIIVLLS